MTVLRVIAILVALGGVLDPALSLSRAVPTPVRLRVDRPTQMPLTSRHACARRCTTGSSSSPKAMPTPTSSCVQPGWTRPRSRSRSRSSPCRTSQAPRLSLLRPPCGARQQRREHGCHHSGARPLRAIEHRRARRRRGGAGAHRTPLERNRNRDDAPAISRADGRGPSAPPNPRRAGERGAASLRQPGRRAGDGGGARRPRCRDRAAAVVAGRLRPAPARKRAGIPRCLDPSHGDRRRYRMPESPRAASRSTSWCRSTS